MSRESLQYNVQLLDHASELLEEALNSVLRQVHSRSQWY